VTRAGGRLLFLYPRAWRERYGQELLEIVEAASGDGRMPMRIRIDVIRAGLSQRLRSSGLVGDELPPEARARAGVLLVLCSWAAFVIAGIGLQKTAEHWQAFTPHSEQAVPAAAFGSLVVAAAIGSAAVLLGIALTMPALVAFLRSGGWRTIRRPAVCAVCLSALTAVVLVAVVIWAHQLTGAQRNGGDLLYAGAFLLLAACSVGSIAAWTLAAVATARHLALTRATLRLEALLAAAVSLTMATMTAAGCVWWASLAGASPTFLAADRMLALGLTMLATTALAFTGTIRAVHDTHLV
jgi:hypothetical protein